jgi:hypothetical protein
MHLHGERVADSRDWTVDNGASEHVGSIELHMALRICQDCEDDGRRRFDSA